MQVWEGDPSPSADVGGVSPSPGADVAALQPHLRMVYGQVERMDPEISRGDEVAPLPKRAEDRREIVSVIVRRPRGVRPADDRQRHHAPR